MRQRWTNERVDLWLVSYKPQIQRVGEVVNVSTKIELKCLVCDNIWNTVWSNICNSNANCPVCARVNRKQTNMERYGVEYTTQSIEKQQKSKQTNLERYGVEYTTQCTEMQQKSKQTKLERYGDENFTNVNKGKQTKLEKYGDHKFNNREKSKQTKLEKYEDENFNNLNKRKITCLEKYGVDNPRKSIIIQHKIKQTMIDRYGVNWYNNREKSKQTYLDRYGVEYNTQKHLVDVLPLITDYDFLYHQYVILKKSAKQISIELCVDGTTIGSYLKKAEIEIRKTHQSYVSKLWLDTLTDTNYIEYEFPIMGTRYKADGYCRETNTVYEFHGDFWHGNPKIYDPNMPHPIIYKTMGELYQRTIEREQHIISLGYNLITIWESEYDRSK